MKEFVARVNERGKSVNLSFKYVGGPEIFPNREGIEAIRKGLVDAGWTTPAYHVGLVPEGDAMKLSQLQPWEERDSGAYDLMNELHQKQANVYFLWRLAFQGYFQLYLQENRTTPDLTGLRLRTSPVYAPLIKALGGATMTSSPGELYTAIDRGVVDGYGMASTGISTWKLEEVTKYIWGPEFYCSPTGVFLNLDAWKGLTEQQRSLITDTALEVERWSGDKWAAFFKSERAAMAKAGMEVIKFSPADEKMYLDTAYNAGWEAVIEKASGAAKLRPLMSK